MATGMSDKQMAMSPAIFSKFVMLRQSKLAIAALKEIYIDEAPRQHVSHDFCTHARFHIAKPGLLLSRGREDFSDFESSVLRLKSTHVADCKPQAPPGRRWDFALELGYGRFLQIKLGPAKSLALESGPRATFGKKHEFKIL